MKKLAIFDIDGTLTKTNAVDNVCYIKATQRFILPSFDTFEEESFPHFTDSAILLEIYKQCKDRLPTEAEKLEFKTYYLDLLKECHEQNPAYFAPIKGAHQVIDYLKSKGWEVAMATGCWMESAQLKLNFAGLDFGSTLISTASSALTRHDIMQNAIDGIKASTGINSFDHTVYIGDGIWDFKTCELMNVPFVGIDAEDSERKRLLLGDAIKLNDYSDLNQVEQLLTTATVPKSA
ncbi:MAG: HAD family hydrolase [Aureispira sp.]|nr:HAD family hydrolase [Aureispira sp.]